MTPQSAQPNSARNHSEMPALKAAEAASLPLFRNILVATDFSPASEAAFQPAMTICKDFGARLTILHVFEHADAVPPENSGLHIDLEELHDDARKSLGRLLKSAHAAGIKADTLMKCGLPSLAILDTIRAESIDLAILGTNALHGFERLVFGSTAEAIIRNADCPVYTVGPRAAKAIHENGPVVFATDFNLVTTGAIRYAAALSKVYDCPLHCLHVLPRNTEGTSANRTIPAIMRGALKHIADEGDMPVSQPACVVVFGSEISNAVLEYARREQAQLIVLGVRQASMMTSHLPEHIAYRIIAEAPCPVMTIAFPTQREIMPTAAACF